MKTEINNNQKYHLAVGYGDWSWDWGTDEYWSDSLEELMEEIDTDLTIEQIKEKIEKEGIAMDDEEMWYIEKNNKKD